MTKEKESYHRLLERLERFFETVDVEEHLSNKKRVIEDFMRHSKELKKFEEQHK